MTHGFDDQGRKYDSEGNMRDWWVGNDGSEYEKRAEVMIKQAETFQVYGVNLKGKLTQGENIADLGGLKLALRALKKHLNVRTSFHDIFQIHFSTSISYSYKHTRMFILSLTRSLYLSLTCAHTHSLSL